MSCNCYTPCDPPCPICSGTTTTSSTTTTTTCKDANVCTDLTKDICVVHPGDTCYAIPKDQNLQDILLHFISMLPVPYNCTTTSTTTKAPIITTTTIIPTTTTTTCNCPSTTTTTSTSTTTTTTLAPCECLTFSLKNTSAIAQTYSYTNCSHVKFNNVSLAPGATVLICVCDENLTYNSNVILALAIGDGCNTSTTTSTSTTSTTSTSSTTTTTTAAPKCEQYRIQSTALPASWSAQSCYGVNVSGSFTVLGQSLYTGCIWSNTLVLNNASIKEIFPCPPPTSTTTSTSSTTTTTTAAPTTTTTTKACRQYAIYSSTGGYATAILCESGLSTTIGVGPGQTILSPCVVVGSVVTHEVTIVYNVPCGSTTTSTTSTSTSTTTTAASTTTTSTSTSTSTSTTSTTTIAPSTTTSTTAEVTTTTTLGGDSTTTTSTSTTTTSTTLEPTTTTTSSTSTTTTEEPTTSTTSTTTTIPPTTTTTTIVEPCLCYTIENQTLVTLNFSYIACGGGPVDDTLGAGLSTNVCSSTYPLGDDGIIITASTVPCTNDGDCVGTTTTSTSTSTTTTTTVEPTTTTSTSTTTTVEPPPTTTTTTVEETYTYYNATQYLNCVQNSAPGAFVLRVPDTIGGGSWWCGDDGYQYQFDSNTSGTFYNITATSTAGSCPSLPC